MFGPAIMYVLLFLSLYVEVFLLVSFIERRALPRRNVSTASGTYTPSVAIVVPCFNEEKGVAATVRSLLALDYPVDKLQVLVVDDGSTDSTLARARLLETDPRVRVFRKENGGKHSAMNLALEHMSAEFIGCLDADSVVEQSALRAIVPLFADPRIAAVTPGIHVREPATLLQHLQAVEYTLSLFNRFMMAALGSVFITPGPFSIFRTSVVRELGGWRHGHSTEDMEMALRLQVAGHLIANAPTAIVHTTTPNTLARLFRQRVRWTYGWLRNAVDYRHLFGNSRFGNLGLLVLPFAIFSIFTGIYFFIRVSLFALLNMYEKIVQFSYAGFLPPSFVFDAFYIPSSALLLLVWVSVALVFALICIGSYIGRGTHLPPVSTPLFLIFYSFLAPLWLSVAVVRAAFKTGVQWR